MKNVLKLTTLLMLLTLSFGFISCSDDDDKDNNSIVGTWTHEEYDEEATNEFMYRETITFRADGAWSVYGEEFISGKKENTYTYSGTYVYREGILTMNYSDGRESETGAVTIKDDKAYWGENVWYRVK